MSYLPPSFVRVRLSSEPDDGPRLWVPLFLLWPLWFFALGCFFVLLMALTAATGTHAFAATFGATRALHQMACALRGVECEVRGPNGLVLVSVL